MSFRTEVAGYDLVRKKWPITELKCLSLLTGIREFHVYLAAAPFVVYTDHISLKYRESLKVSAHNRLGRWSLALQPYKFTVEHVSGSKLTAADGLSRRPYDTPVNLDGDEETQEDSFIAQIDADIFESTVNSKLRPPKRTSDRHISSLNPIIDELTTKTDASSNTPNSPSATDDVKDEFIDLWSPQ